MKKKALFILLVILSTIVSVTGIIFAVGAYKELISLSDFSVVLLFELLGWSALCLLGFIGALASLLKLFKLMYPRKDNTK